MQFFLDTAEIKEIETGLEWGMVDGVTTNPSLIAKAGKAYLPTVQEITPEEWATIEPKTGTPKYAKAREEFISEILNRKPKKLVEEEVPATPPPEPETVVGRRGR